jgi:hypothetical protein
MGCLSEHSRSSGKEELLLSGQNSTETQYRMISGNESFAGAGTVIRGWAWLATLLALHLEKRRVIRGELRLPTVAHREGVGLLTRRLSQLPVGTVPASWGGLWALPAR